jgi:hypothetical protein
MATGGRFAASLAVRDRRVAEVSVTLAESAEPPHLHAVPLVHNRHFPAWAPGEKPLHQLVSSEVRDVEFGPVWRGAGDFRFFPGADPDLASLAPVEMGAGYAFTYAETLVGGHLLG